MITGRFISPAAFAAGLTLLGSASAMADAYTEKVATNNTLAVYTACDVRAIVQYNTHGVLVQRASTSWVISGNVWTKVYSPPVYMMTERVISHAHTTLVPGVVSCPPGL
jgi:hypothetical protein